NDARIEALEIEHPYVRMQPRDRLEHMPALLGRIDASVIRSNGGRDDASPLELAQIEEVEGGDARGHAIRCHAGQLAARERERDQVQALDDLIGKASVRARVQRECSQVV